MREEQKLVFSQLWTLVNCGIDIDTGSDRYHRYKMMWPVLSRIVTKFPTVRIILALPLGILGYFIEGLISNRYTPSTKSVTEQREERLLDDIDSTTDKKRHNPLEFNLPPSLSV
ncbi:uncharacterized protein LOC117607452 [Osmia lignaria lignaria]|uniref:uncharacterized protein LOC117607452 n=1 Tax=Osmia lignaria lignaria TaxID=1437193 RepID=UPI00147880C8|nr:uncharacterized protein LOC117607452 [Osmia lignaria]